jgi:hypothetical protein
MKSSMQSLDFSFLLFDSTTLINSEMLNYQTATIDILVRAHDQGINISSIVGDGFSSQLFGLSAEYPTAIQNDDVICEEHPWIKKICYIYCQCHLANLVISDCQKHSMFMSDCRDRLNQISVELRKKKNRIILGKVCPKLSSTRWCHDYLLCAFIARNIEQIRQTSVVVQDEIMAYGMLLEPIFHLICNCERRSARLFMRPGLEGRVGSHFDHLAAKYIDLPYVGAHCRLLKAAVSERFSTHNRHLANLGHALTSHLTCCSDQVDPLAFDRVTFLDRWFENRRNEEAIVDILL